MVPSLSRVISSEAVGVGADSARAGASDEASVATARTSNITPGPRVKREPQEGEGGDGAPAGSARAPPAARARDTVSMPALRNSVGESDNASSGAASGGREASPSEGDADTAASERGGRRQNNDSEAVSETNGARGASSTAKTQAAVDSEERGASSTKAGANGASDSGETAGTDEDYEYVASDEEPWGSELSHICEPAQCSPEDAKDAFARKKRNIQDAVNHLSDFQGEISRGSAAPGVDVTGERSDDECCICGDKWAEGQKGWLLCDGCDNDTCSKCIRGLSLPVADTFFCPDCRGSGRAAEAAASGGTSPKKRKLVGIGDIEEDICLSMEDPEYKAKIRGNGYDWSDVNELGEKLYNELKAEVDGRGGKLRRASAARRSFRPTGRKNALKKIILDLKQELRRKQAKSESPEKKTASSPLQKSSVFPDEAEEGPVAAPAVSGGPTKIPDGSPVGEKCLVLSLDKSLDFSLKYEVFISDCIGSLLMGNSNFTFDQIASSKYDEVNESGGRVYKVVNNGKQHVILFKQEATKKMKEHLRRRLIAERKDRSDMIELTMNSNEYKNEVIQYAKAIAENGDASMSDMGRSISAADIGDELLKKFTSSGAKYFFKDLGDEVKLSRDEVLAKIAIDIENQASTLCSGDVITPKPSDDIYVSSSGRKRKSLGSDSYDLMADYVKNRVMHMYGWEVKRRSIVGGLDEIVASRMKPGTEDVQELKGVDAIMKYVLLSGIYEKDVVEGADAQAWLQKAGILDDPYSIFDEELKQERKRRKSSQQHYVPVQNEITAQEGHAAEQHSAGTDMTSDPEANGKPSSDPLAKQLAGASNESNTVGNANGIQAPKDEDGVQAKSSDKANSNAEQQPNFDENNLNKETGSSDPNAPDDVVMKDNATDQNAAITTAAGVESSNANASSTPNAATSPTGDASGENLSQNAETQTSNQAASAPELQAKHEGAPGASPGRKAMSRETRKKLLQTFKSVNAKVSGSASRSNAIETLQNDFYSHIKSWLARFKSGISEGEMQEMMDEFEGSIEELRQSDGDEESANFYAGMCEELIEACREKLPLAKSE